MVKLLSHIHAKIGYANIIPVKEDRRTAQAFAWQVGINPEHVLAEVSPQDKASRRFCLVVCGP